MKALGLYLAASLCKLLCTLTGVVMIPLALLFKGEPEWLWKLWCNPEDGWDTPPWYGDSFWAKYVYHAFRNPGAGMRNFKWYSPLPMMNRVHSKGNIVGAGKPPTKGKWYWFHAWQDDRHGFYLTRQFGNKWLDFRVGWKVTPRDANAIDPKKARWGYGFTSISPTFHDM